MSGICGIISLRNAPPPEGTALRRLTSLLEQRGPDGTTHWLEGCAALGHTCLASTPEARVEILPLIHSESGCVITADIRLDNREDLARKLTLDLRARIIGDGEIVLTAWLKWGEACVEHLLGDFAFAIWDPRVKKLFAARDQMGMKQFIYGVENGSRLIFASRPKAVRCAAPESFPINDARIADFLEDMEGIDLKSTFYRDIFRLPPAYYLVFDANGLRLSRYWNLEMPSERVATSEGEHEEAFLEAFSEAVCARLRSNGPIGSMMSGGMDSSSIVAIASEQLVHAGAGPLRTYSLVSPTSGACKETQAIDAMMALQGLQTKRILRDGPEDRLKALLTAMRESEEPFDSTMSLLRAVYSAAQGDGLRVVLDGAGGDVVFSGGDVHARLLSEGRWRAILKDAAGARNFWDGYGPRPAWALASALWRLAVPEVLRQSRRVLMSRLRPAKQHQMGTVSDGLALRVEIAARRRRCFNQLAPWGQAGSPRLGAVLGRNMTVGRERYDRVASEFGIEPRDPFMDLRVIRACLQTPPQFMQAKGWPKYMLRQAMKGRLPDAVRWRQDKSHLGWQLTTETLAQYPGFDNHDVRTLRSYGVHEDAIRNLIQTQKGISLTPCDVALMYLLFWDPHA